MRRWNGVTLLSVATASCTWAWLAGCTGDLPPEQQAPPDAGGGTADGSAAPDGTSGTDGGAQVDATTGEGGGASGGGGSGGGGSGSSSGGGRGADGGSGSSGSGSGSGSGGGTASTLDASVHDAGPDGDAADGEAALVVLVPFQYGREINGIAVDSTYVYWTASGNADENIADAGTFVGIMRVPKTGGTPSAVYNAVSGEIDNTLFVDDTSVYFHFDSASSVGVGSFLKVAKNGSTDAGAAEVLDQERDPAGTEVTVDGVNLYFESGNGIYSVPIGGGPQTTVVDPMGPSPADPVSGQPIGIPTVFSLASDGTDVYYAAGALGGIPAWILKVPVGGGMPAIVVSGEEDAGPGGPYASYEFMHPTVNGGFLYWTGGTDSNGGTGSLYRISVDGGSPLLLAATTTDANPVTDGTNVYYLSGTGGGGNGALMKVPVAGGASVVVAHERGRYDFGAIDDGAEATPIAVDDTSVYLMSNSDQGIVKVAK